MILTFLYHRIGNSKYSNSIEMLEKHLSYLKKKYNIVLPGETSAPIQVNICLSFDDAYFDFYHFVFPLLKKLNIKALLAVPVKYILESTTVDPDVRLSVPHKMATDDNIYKSFAPFCTWKELNEMAKSGLVQIACHSFSHKNLLLKELDLKLEIIESKKILENKLNLKISTFVYPLGKFNRKIHKLTKKHYIYAMRIGSSFNLSWQNINKIGYRINSDNLKSIDQNLKFSKMASYLWFYFLNVVRGR